MMSFQQRLQKTLQGDLPGLASHVKMVSPVRRKIAVKKQHTERTQAAVLVLFYPVEDIPHLVYIKRTGDFGVPHGGQLSFPGGRAEAEDDSLEQTALREAQEEVGIDSAEVKVLGRLSSLYIPVSNFLVHPYVGWLDHKPDLTPEESEVAEILEVPLPHLQQHKTIGETSIQVREDLTIDNVPYYDLFGHVLWGATAMMTSELLDIVPRMRES